MSVGMQNNAFEPLQLQNSLKFLAMALYKMRYPYLKISNQAIKTEKGYLFKVNGKIDDHTEVSCTPLGSPKRHAEK